MSRELEKYQMVEQSINKKFNKAVLVLAVDERGGGCYTPKR